MDIENNMENEKTVQAQAVEIVRENEVKEYVKERFLVNRDTAKGILQASYLTSGEISLGAKGKGVSFTFKNILAAFFFCDALKKRRKVSVELQMEIPADGRRSRKLHAEIPEYQALLLLEDIGAVRLDKQGALKGFLPRMTLDEESRAGFFAQLFLETGKLTCYEDYRLELRLPNKDNCDMVAEELRLLEINVGVSDNATLVLRTNAIYYYLALCGANKHAIAISEYYVQREKNQQLARIGNFDAANTDKALTAAAYQCWAISTLRKADKLSMLSPERRELALAREKYQDMSLGDLAAMLGISKSTAFHRMKAITDLAEEFRK